MPYSFHLKHQQIKTKQTEKKFYQYNNNSRNKMSNYKDDMKKVYEPDIVIENAVPAQPDNIPAGHSRFYCEKCRTPYDLPQHATSWRCANCSTFNSITPAECPRCVIS